MEIHMAFKAVFVGINRHLDPGVPELTGAVRDAQALHALFQDTFSDIEARLLIDSEATLDAIRANLDRTLSTSTDDDVVVISFAGHGTEAHQIVAYDTDRDEIGSSTLPMEELAAKFKSSRARAILCIVDCCFSGAAPARVLEGTPHARAHFDFKAFEGKGRFLIAAASPIQPAWEEPGTGHGLLTGAIVEVLTSGTEPIDITAAIAEIVAKTRKRAIAIGENQDPCFVGGIEGKLELPALQRGSHWHSLFPDLQEMKIGKAIDELTGFGLPSDVIQLWKARYPDGLNELQLEAVNRHRVLNGESLLVVAPTSSGKTFIGELAAVRAALANRKTVFLLPYRALVNEKYEDFAAMYGQVGLRVIRCSGDFTDEAGLFLSGRYDIAFLTFEMFLALGVATPHVLKRLGLVVLDEAQFVTDPTRGITVELLLTLLLAGKTRGVNQQLIALSAVIGDVNNFDEWLGSKRLVWTKRPIPLTEGVLDRQGVYQSLDADGNEVQTQLLPTYAVRQRKAEPSAQDVIVPLAQSLVKGGEKLLVFRNTRGPAEGCANYLSKDLGLPPAADAIAALSIHDISSSGERLRQCLSGGTAFHNSNLTRDERVVIERHFRDPKGGIEVLAATTTLAAGINTPASTVILAEQEFIGEDGRPFTVAEYKNMAGRAGRLGFNETGKAIILADTPFQRRELFNRYVRGTPESIRSSFTDHDFRTWVIRLLSQVKAVKESDVPHLLSTTYGGFLAHKADPKWRTDTEGRIAEIVTQFVELGLLERQDGHVQLTLLGRACGQSSLAFDSSMRLIEAIRSTPDQDRTAFSLIGLLQVLPEADKLYTPVRKKARTESVRVTQAAASFGNSIVRALQRWVGDEFAFWARCKRAAILADWMNGTSIQEIEGKFSVPFGGQVQSGDINRFADATRFHLRSAHQILSALLSMSAEQEIEFEKVERQLEFGVPHDLVAFMQAPLLLSRGEALALANAGIRSRQALGKMDDAGLRAVLGKDRASALQAALKADPDQTVVAA
jgi:helicase